MLKISTKINKLIEELELSYISVTVHSDNKHFVAEFYDKDNNRFGAKFLSFGEALNYLVEGLEKFKSGELKPYDKKPQSK